MGTGRGRAIRIPDNTNWNEGDVLRLCHDLGSIPAGNWVILELDWMVKLSRLGENEDGDMCTTARVEKVTWAEIEHFAPMGFNLFEADADRDYEDQS